MRWPWVLGGLLCITVALVLAALPWIGPRVGPWASSSADAHVLALALPQLGTAPTFRLTNRFGQPFNSSALTGKIWVADFMFTTCPLICPTLSGHMAILQSRLEDQNLQNDVRIVGFSIDPETDTPEKLRAYGETYGANPDIWKLLTGERADIWSLCRDGFKLHVQDNPGNTDEPITHSGKFVLVDRHGVIREYYDGMDPTEVDRLAADITALVAEP